MWSEFFHSKNRTFLISDYIGVFNGRAGSDY